MSPRAFYDFPRDESRSRSICRAGSGLAAKTAVTAARKGSRDTEQSLKRAGTGPAGSPSREPFIATLEKSTGTYVELATQPSQIVSSSL